jgi:hypothetical protein
MKKKGKMRTMVSSNYNYETADAWNSSCTLQETISESTSVNKHNNPFLE